MSSPNGNSDIAPKRRKVSTTESTSSVASNKEEQQHQVSPSPARASRRIAGKERSYSHKFGYGEDEAILLLDDEKRKSSPKKPISNDGKEDAKLEPKRKPQKRANDVAKGEPAAASNRSSKTNAKPSRNKSLDEKSDDTKDGRNSTVDESKPVESRKEGEVSEVNVNEKGESSGNKKSKPEADDRQVSKEAVPANEDGISGKIKDAPSKPDVNDNEEHDATSTLLESGPPAKRKNANRAVKASDTPNPPVRRTRQTANEQALMTEVNSDKLEPQKAPEKIENDTSFKVSLPAKKRPFEARQQKTEFHPPITTNATPPVKSGGGGTQQFRNATQELIEELKTNKTEQALIIHEFRQNRDEQQKVIDDLRKHRELQEKLIEDLRHSRDEKQVEVEKLRAQQRASSILFHRERDVPLSRYDDMSDHGSSDREEYGSVENLSTQEIRIPAKSPLSFDGVLENVLSYTSSPDLVSCRLVSKQWDKIASNAYRKNGMVALKYGVSDFLNVVQTSSSLFPMTAFNIFLTESFVKDTNTEVFARRYCNHIVKLKLTLEYFYTDLIPINNLRQFLPPYTPNLEHLVLKLPCKFLSMPATPNPDEDYGFFMNNTPTKLKSLKVVCQCTPILHEEPEIADTHFQRGLLAEILENSPNLTTFEFKSGRFDTNRTLLRRVVDLLNRVNLPKLQHLSLRGLELQDLEAPGFLPNYNLKSLYLNAVPWKRVEAIWIQHKGTLEAVTIGKVITSLDLNTTALANFVFSSLKELVIHPKIEDPSIFSSFSRLFPSLRKLELHDPSDSTVLSIWKELTRLEELILDYSNEVGDNEKYKILHLDSLLSGFSINNCELILKKIMKKGLPQNLEFGAVERFGQGPSIQNMTSLQKLVITSSSKSIPFRITEVGLVLVLLRMKTLTSITINPCVLMKDTMRQLVGRISPAIYLSITCPEKEDDYESAKIALL